METWCHSTENAVAMVPVLKQRVFYKVHLYIVLGTQFGQRHDISLPIGFEQ